MDPSGIDSFENQWRKALKDASEAPPPSVWEGIEARLEEDNEKGLLLPLWWQSPKMWYAAASIVALLLVGAGLWYSGTGINDKKSSTIASNKPGRTRSNSEKQVAVPQTGKEDPKKTKEAIANSGEGSRPNSGSIEEEVAIASSVKSKGGNESVTENPGRKFSLGKEYSSRVAKREGLQIASQTPSIIETEKKSLQNADSRSEDLALSTIRTTKEVAPAAEPSKQQNTTVELLSSLPYGDLDVHVQKRYVFFRPELKSEEPIKLSTHREYWAGIGLMPASFNPDVKVKSAPLAFSNQTIANKKSVSGSSEAGVSYALQTQGGMRLSKHWSLELGVSYLKGNSDYQGGGYLLSANNSSSANVLEDAFAGVAPAANPSLTDKSNNFANNGSIYVDVSKKVSNNYQYLQLPVQAGFTINPDKKLSYSVLGGMMANFFLSNDLESASGQIITTTASDEIYRTMNWAATTGLRFNYRLTSRWKASLTGSYQKSVSSGFKSNQSLDAHPYLYGVAWGVRYSF